MNRGYANYSIVEIGRKTKKSREDLRRLEVTQTSVKAHRLMLVRKTCKENNNNNNKEKKRLITSANNSIITRIDLKDQLEKNKKSWKQKLEEKQLYRYFNR